MLLTKVLIGKEQLWREIYIYIYIYLYIYKYIFCRTFHGGSKNVHSLPYGERII